MKILYFPNLQEFRFSEVWSCSLQACFFLQFIIYKFSLSGCLLGCLYSINVKTAEPIGPNFFVGSSMTLVPREGLRIIKILKLYLHQNSIFNKFLKILKIHEIFWWNPQIFFCFVVHKEKMGAKRPKSLVFVYLYIC